MPWENIYNKLPTYNKKFWKLVILAPACELIINFQNESKQNVLDQLNRFWLLRFHSLPLVNHTKIFFFWSLNLKSKVYYFHTYSTFLLLIINLLINDKFYIIFNPAKYGKPLKITVIWNLILFQPRPIHFVFKEMPYCWSSQWEVLYKN